MCGQFKIPNVIHTHALKHYPEINLLFTYIDYLTYCLSAYVAICSRLVVY